MKKFSLLVGTLGGAMAGYLFSNKKLREELVNAKDPEAAAKLLGRHLQKDGKKLARQVQKFVESEEVQKNISKAKSFAKEKADRAAEELQELVGRGQAKAKEQMGKAKKSAKRTANRVTKAAKKTAKRTTRRVRARMKRVS